MVKYLNLVIISLLFVILYLIYTRQASFMDAVKAGCVTAPGDCPPGLTASGNFCTGIENRGGLRRVRTTLRPMVTKCSGPMEVAAPKPPPKCVTVPGDCPPGSIVVGAMCRRKGPFGIMVATGPRPMVTKCS
jgi:hypothetical protein